MSLFQPPPITRFDLHFTLFGFPVRVHPLFWLVVIVFGLSSASITALLIWVVVVFISILVHELGHAFAMRMYGLDSRIVLHMAGGLTVPGGWAGAALGRGEEIIVSFAGPLAGFLLAGLVMGGVVGLGGSIRIAPAFGIIPLPVAVMPL